MTWGMGMAVCIVLLKFIIIVRFTDSGVDCIRVCVDALYIGGLSRQNKVELGEALKHCPGFSPFLAYIGLALRNHPSGDFSLKE
jgi:hypothetical protein